VISDIQEILVDEQAIAKRVGELGSQLSADYLGKNPVLVCVLKGSSVFFSDLIREMPIPLEIEFLKASSYGSAAQSSGKIELQGDLSMAVQGRHILLVEDIVDTGNTLKFLLERFKGLGAEDVKVCSLLDKPHRREQRVIADYIGFQIPDEFVVGYGLDFAQKYRNLPYIGILKKEVYE